MDGVRIETTGECDLELTGKESKAMKVAIVYTLHCMMKVGQCDEETMATLAHMNDALTKLGVEIDG